MLERSSADPRVFVVIGDTPPALAALEGLRSVFTGKLICIPLNQEGAFENVDMLKKTFKPMELSEAYMVEEDFF